MDMMPDFKSASLGSPRLTGMHALRSLLGKVQYKPEWSFGLKHLDTMPMLPGDPTYMLLIYYKAPDAYRPSSPRQQKFTVTVPSLDLYPDQDWPDEDAWARWLFRVIVYLEEHEAAEFLLIDGQRPYDPHKPDFRSLVGIPRDVLRY